MIRRALLLAAIATFLCPTAGWGQDRPTEQECRDARAPRTAPPILALDPQPGAPRVFAIQFKQDVRHVTTYAAFRTKIECLLLDVVVPHLARDRPNVVALDEDVGLATIATGSRGRTAREIFADPSRSPSCEASAGAPCGAVGALGAIRASYAKAAAAYQAKFPDLGPLEGAFVAATDTFVRGFMTTFSELAKRYGVYILGSNNQAPFTESTDPRDVAAFADPDLPEPPRSVYVATEPVVYNEVFMWGPDGRVVASNKKVPVTPIEQQLEISEGPATVENLQPYALPGTQARIGFATSLPAFVYGALPPGADPCADIARFYMRCLDKLGTNVVMQDEANPGRWAAYTAKDSPDRGAWQTMSWMTSTWRAVADPAVGFAYNVTPHLVGNLADLPFDGQTAITQRGLRTGPGCAYVGNSRFIDGTDPERFEIGGEPLEVRPFAGPKPEFLAMVPWVRADGPREELQQTAAQLAPDGNGELENDYLETAIVADLPFPPNPNRPSCHTRTARAPAPTTPTARRRKPLLRVRAIPRRIRADRRTRVRIRVVTWAGRTARPVRRARVTVARRRARTNRRGIATLRLKLGPGRYAVRARAPGTRAGRATLRATRAPTARRAR